VTNRLFIQGIQNLFSGYVYNMVLNGRVRAISKAKEEGKRTVQLIPYHEDFQKQVKASAQNKLGRQLLSHVNEWPLLIHYADPLEDTFLYIRYFAACYKIDTIEINGKKFPRQQNKPAGN